MMSGIRGKHTKPELVVRSMVHSLGLRFRLHRADLPGKPDLVLPKFCTVILVHGCFWHRHQGCALAATPKSRIEFWNEKFASNVERDRKNREELNGLGWRVLEVWECETRDPKALRDRLRDEFQKH